MNKNIIVVFLIILGILILVLVRNSSQDLFKAEVKEAIDGTLKNGNIISPDQLKNSSKSWIIVNLSSEDLPENLHFENSIHLPFENLLDQTNRKILKESQGDLILYSADAATSAKAWIILDQLGFKNVFILSSGENSEVLKYKFQPDSTARLEQISK